MSETELDPINDYEDNQPDEPPPPPADVPQRDDDPKTDEVPND